MVSSCIGIYHYPDPRICEVMPPKLDLSLTGSNMQEEMKELKEKTDAAKSDIDKLRGQVATLSRYMSDNRNRVESIERHIKQQVAESLKSWQAHLDIQLGTFTREMNSWQDVLQQSVTKTCTHMTTGLETVRSNGQKAVETMKTTFDAEAQQLAERGDKLEAFAMAQFCRLDSKMEAMDRLVQQSAEMLQDVKKRQENVHKIQDHRNKEGPLMQMFSQGESASPADVRCRANQAFEAARHRSVSAERDEIRNRIHHAQDVAVTARGRIGSRLQAAQRVARSLSRHVSRADV
jgi:chromosome segregation ATPase